LTEAIKVAFGSVVGLAFLFGDTITFAYLVWRSSREVDEWWRMLLLIPLDFFMAMIWPIYWALLHWIR
jgi:hypothetical protein